MAWASSAIHYVDFLGFARCFTSAARPNPARTLAARSVRIGPVEDQLAQPRQGRVDLDPTRVSKRFRTKQGSLGSRAGKYGCSLAAKKEPATHGYEQVGGLGHELDWPKPAVLVRTVLSGITSGVPPSLGWGNTHA